MIKICNLKIKRILILSILSLYPMMSFANNPNKAAWYRYYDSRGIANISSTVTPAHIRHGYEALDKNMQVIQKNRAYSVEADLKQAPQRAVQAKQHENDQKLKRAYNNSNIATQKRNVALQAIKKQIDYQQTQLKQLQNDRVQFKREEMEFTRKGKAVPANLKNNLAYNLNNLSSMKQNIQSLQVSYLNTQAEYDKIIARLKVIE
ncbi:hypothetical protein A6M14_02290 [Acinetobacter sp. Ac_877]|nr:hypothetical protein [Acinetobacter portensis]